MADGVPVDLVHDVPFVRRHVQKAVGVDGTALGGDVRTGEGLVLRDVGSQDILRHRRADAVVRGTPGDLVSVVQHERTVVLVTR